MRRSWVWWSVVAGGSFTVLEAVALLKNKNGEGTFSEFFRLVTGVRPAKAWRIPSSVVLALVLVWFWFHIVTGVV